MCGIESNLEIDHIDPATKAFEVGERTNLAWENLLTEVEKCQLLCAPCHKAKSDREKAVEHGGGASGRRNCKCEPCRDRKREYMRNWKIARKQASLV